MKEDVTLLQQAKVQLKLAKEKWEKFVSNEKHFKEEELLDQYNRSLEEGETPEIKEKRQKAIKSVKDKLQRNNTFSYLTRTLGKPKNALKKLRIKNENDKSMNTCYERKTIEEELIKFNRKHLSKAK